MSIYTVNGRPVKYDNKWLAPGGTHDLPPYDSTDAGKALVVNNEGDDVEWKTVSASGVVDQHYDYTSSNAQSGTAVAEAISTKQDTISDLSDIRSGAEAGATAVQPSDLATVATTGDYGDLLNRPTIPAAVTVDQHYSSSSTNPQSGTAVAEALQTVPDELPSITGNSNKVLKVNADATGVEWATESAGTTYTAGSNIQINGNVISATDTTYTAGTGLTLNGTEFSADTTVLATQQDLSGKQNALTAGSNITITGDTISATDTTYSAGTGLSLNGTTFSNADPLPAHTSGDDGKILKVDAHGDLEWGTESSAMVTDVQVNGSSVVSGGVASITVPAAQVQSDWSQTNNQSVDFIKHKPGAKPVLAGPGIQITETSNDITISTTTLSGISEIKFVQSLPLSPVAGVLYLIPQT